MDAIRRYRAVAVEVTCPDQEQPLHWENHTTMTDDELRRRAERWAAGVWEPEHGPCSHPHPITITEVSEVSTGSRRG